MFQLKNNNFNRKAATDCANVRVFDAKDTILERARSIVTEEQFAQHLGIRLISAEPDKVVVQLPYGQHLGVGRVHGGAISAMVDVAATACFWSDPDLTDNSRGATVGFTINYLSLSVATDLTAIATIRRRGGTLCTGDVSVQNPNGDEVATAIVTYKLNR
ncbi:MAG: PaaI family thioesterase [Pseudomonadota bacterium]